jgi:Fur family peroxide stress response transcriptional regulator
MLVSDRPQSVLVRRMREAGVRVTPQRLAIYSALISTDTHPTAKSLYEHLSPGLPSLSLATVYNTLRTLVVHGLVHELGDAGDGCAHYDGDLTPHIHLICTCCHQVRDFFGPSISAVAAAVAEESGYRLQGARLAYIGICPKCSEPTARLPGV